jgi:uncharacterized membrane-anchored protein
MAEAIPLGPLPPAETLRRMLEIHDRFAGGRINLSEREAAEILADLDKIAEHRGAFAAADAYRARCAKAEAALVAMIARLDAGGGPADVLADIGTILDEARVDLQAGDPPCPS